MADEDEVVVFNPADGLEKAIMDGLLYRREVDKLKDRMKALEEKLETQRNEFTERINAQETRQLKAEVNELREENRALREEVSRLSGDDPVTE